MDAVNYSFDMATRTDQSNEVLDSEIKILIVEDESVLSELLSMAIKAEGWQARSVANGYDVLPAQRDFQPHAIILDIMLPGIDGIEVARRIREQHDDIPIMFLTAKDDISDRIGGLKVGADDYVTKPFNLEEVILRLRALLRRHLQLQAETSPVLVVGDLRLNYDNFEVTRAGQPIDLTATEFALLRYLMENPKRVLSKNQILEHVWDYDFGTKSAVVEIFISYLRKKIDHAGGPMIHTLRGLGYSIRPASD